MANVEINIEDHSAETLEALEAACEYAGTVIGLKAETYAKLLTPYRTGRLRGSIANKYVKSEKAVYIGTNVEYAPYIEGGHHSYAGKHMLKNSVANHIDEYIADIKSAMKNA